MTLETPDAFDIHLQNLFAPVHPTAGFEDRLVNAVRQHRRLRLTIPPAVRKAALAAAAVLVVGTTGYYGNLAMMRNLRVSEVNHPAIAFIPQNDRIQKGDCMCIEVSDLVGLGFESTKQVRVNDSGNIGMPLIGQIRAEGLTEDELIKAITDAYRNRQIIANPQVTITVAEAANHRANEQFDALPVPSATVPLSDQRMQPGGNGHSINAALPASPLGGKMESNVSGLNSFSYNSVIDAPKAPPTPYFNFRPDDAKKADSIGLDSIGLGTVGSNVYSGGTFVTGGVLMLGTESKSLSGKSNAESTPQSSEDHKEGPSPLDAPAGKTRDVGQNSLHGADTTGFNGDQKKGQSTLKSLSSIDLSVDDHDVAFAGPNAAAAPLQGWPDYTQNGVPVPATQAAAAAVDDRKIIRTGTMEFDVDRFDTAQMQITKIVFELGGFVGATDSTKLPNGKVRGSIAVRVPPERLDVLVMSLRALGDLKSQQITAADITKEYTDIESELAADRAMQDRLLDLIHNGKGAVKDLLAAENELGTWRAKIEKAEGMIRYYNGQVALSTLTITLSERDIQTPATAIETETADVGIEADDVENARNSALKAIDDAKGRIIEAELKRFDAGQLAARLVADVPPESAGAIIDQLKLLGKVARLEINRQQNTSDGSNPVTAITPLKTERKPTRLLISIYNLANVAPRRTTNVSLAAADVEAAYTALVTAARSNGGRVVTSNLDRGDPVKATGSLVLEFPPEKFELAMMALHAQGDVLKLTLVENPDTQNSTEAKQGLTVQLMALAAVPPRETIQQTLAASDVPTAYQSILSAISSAHARVQSAQLNEQDRQNITADLQLEIPRSAQADFDKALSAAGGTIARTSTQSAQAEGTVDSKVQMHLSITSADHLAARETTKLQIEVPDVDRSAADAQAVALAAGGRVLEATVTKDHSKGVARLILDLPLNKAGDVLQQLRSAGTVRGIDASRDPQAPAGALAHAQIYIEFGTSEAIVSDQTGPWASIRQGLSTSITGLLWSLQWVVVGLCLILPWAVIGWIGWKVKGKIRRTKFEAVE